MSAYTAVPGMLKDIPHWVVWKREMRDGKETKVPYAKTGDHAKSNDASTWTTFDEAVNAADPLQDGDYDGVGFMLHGTNLVGIDFDGVVAEGKIDPYVDAILKSLGYPYCEVTPSSRGLRCFVQCAKLPEGQRKFSSGNHFGIEIYSGGEGGRYLTVTGDKFKGDGIPTFADLELPYVLISKFRDQHFKKLWLGDASDYENDDSRVDLALLGALARIVNSDKQKTIALFNASVPGHREKWVNRADYREMTINKILDGTSKENNHKQKLEFHSDPVTEKTSFDYVVGPPFGSSEFGFDGWFPLGQISLIGGSSGTGKTTFMLDLLINQALKQPILNHPTYGRPYLVMMCDRGDGSHDRTMRRMGYALNLIPIKFLSVVWGHDAAQEIIDRLEEVKPAPQVIFIEGLDMLVSDPNKMEVVASFLSDLQKIACHFHVAIIGSCGAPKQKGKDAYTAKRDSIFGSAVWSRMTETIMTIQYPGGQDTAEDRELTVHPRNNKAEQFSLVFDHGRLVLKTEEPAMKMQTPKEVQWMQLQPSDKWWTALDVEREFEVNRSTAWRWVKDAMAKGYITQKPGKKCGKGAAEQYRWNNTKKNPLWSPPSQETEPEMEFSL